MQLTETQLRILAALSRPARHGNGFAPPATNQEIADEVFLSVDAVKAHLRTLYRKFGIEELPHNQKRACLVELVIEGGYLEGAPVAVGEGREGGAATAPVAAAPSSPLRLSRTAVLAGIAGVVLIAIAILAATGAFSGGGGAGEATSPAAYRAAVGGYCRLGLEAAQPAVGGRRARARAYLAAIETVRGRVGSLPPPPDGGRALQRFQLGLASAADNTGIVAEDPPPAGSTEQAQVVAELTLAAGQVQAGALGYHLGRECLAVGDLVARSARNAARAG